MAEDRTSLSEAVKIVLKEIEKKGTSHPLTINDIARDTKLNQRTVKKVVDILECTNSALTKKSLLISRTGSGRYIEMEPKQMGLLGLPQDVQMMLIRTKYFPQPSREQEILTHLYLRGAFQKDSAVNLMEDETVKKLEKTENIEHSEKESGFFLTDIGKNVAEGTMEIYPELKKM